MRVREVLGCRLASTRMPWGRWATKAFVTGFAVIRIGAPPRTRRRRSTGTPSSGEGRRCPENGYAPARASSQAASAYVTTISTLSTSTGPGRRRARESMAMSASDRQIVSAKIVNR